MLSRKILCIQKLIPNILLNEQARKTTELKRYFFKKIYKKASK